MSDGRAETKSERDSDVFNPRKTERHACKSLRTACVKLTIDICRRPTRTRPGRRLRRESHGVRQGEAHLRHSRDLWGIARAQSCQVFHLFLIADI